MSVGGPSLGSASYEFEVRMQGFIAGLNAAKQQAGAASDQIGSKFQKMGQQLTNAGRDLSLGVTIPIAAAGVAVLKAGSDFEDAFTGIQKTVQATPEQFAEINQEIRDLALNIPTTREELASIGEIAGQLGVEAENITNFSETVARLGVTTNLVSGQAATQFARLFNIMGEGNDQIDEFGSVLVDLGNNFATTEGEILDMSARLAPVLATFDVGTGEVLAFATALSSMNIQAEAGGTALGRLFITIGNAVAKGGEDLEKFAEIAGQSTEAFRQGFEEDSARAVQAFLRGLNAMDASGTETIQLLEDLELDEIRLRQATLALAEGYDTLDEALVRQGTSFARNEALIQESERRFATFSSQIQILQNQLSDAGVELFSSLRPIILQFVEIAIDGAEVLGQLAEAFSKLPPDVQSFVVGALAATAAIGPLAVAIGGLITVLGALAGPVGIAVVAAAALGGVAAAIATHQSDYERAVDRWEATTDRLGVSVEDFPPPPQEKGRQWGHFLSEWASYDWDDFFNDVGRLATLGRGDPTDIPLLDMNPEDIALNAELLEQLRELAELADDPRQRVELNVNTHEVREAILLLDQVEAILNEPELVDAAIRVRVEGMAEVNEYVTELDNLRNLAQTEQLTPIQGPFFTAEQLGVPQLKEIFSEFPEIAADSIVDIIRVVESGAISYEEAFLLYENVPRETIIPAIEALEEELQGKIADALLTGEDVSMLEQQFALLQQLFPDLAQAAEPLGRITDNIQTGITGWAEAQAFLSGNINSSAEAIGTWEREAKDIERAMEITQRQFEDGAISAAEYEETMGFLEQAHARVTAGIEDDLEPAFVQAVKNREELRNIIDETNQAIEDEIAKNDDSAEGQARLAELYAERDRAQRDFTAALIGSENPQERLIGHQYELASVFSTVIGELRTLLSDLGLLDDADAEPEITVDTAATSEDIQFLEENVTNFPDGKEVTFTTPNIDQTTQRIQFLEENVTDFPQPDQTVFTSNDTEVVEALSRLGQGFTEYETRDIGEPTLDVNKAPADANLSDIEGRLNAFELGYYSVTVDANVAPAIANLAFLRQNLPSSPADIGPLAFTPDWTWLFEGLESSANEYSSEALDHIQKFVNTSNAILETYGKTLEFSLEARNFSGRLPTLDFIQELAAFTASITAEVGFQAQQFEEGFLEATNRFNQTAQGSLSTLTQAFEAINQILEGPDIPADIDFGSRLAPLFRFIEVTSDAIVELGEDFPPERAVLAQGFSATAQSILDLISKGAETLASLRNAQPDLGNALAATTAIKFLVEHAMLAIGDTAAVMNSSQGDVDHPSARGEGFVGAADSFAQSAASVLDLMKAGAELIGALADLDRFDLDGAMEFTSNLKFLIEHMMLSIGDTAAIMNSSQGSVDHPGARGEGFVGAAASFAESAQQVVGLMADALSFVSDLAAFEGRFNLAEAQEFASRLKFLIEHIALSIGDTVQYLEATRGADFLDGVTEFSEHVSAATAAMRDTLEFVVLLSDTIEQVTLSTDQIDAYSAALAGIALRIAENFNAAASHWEETEEGSISELAGAVGDAVGALTDVLAFHESLATGLEHVVFSTEQVDAYSAGLAGVALEIARNFDAAASHWEETKDGSISDLSSAVSDSVGALADVLSFLGALSETTDAAWAQTQDVNIAADRLAEVALILADEFSDAAEEWDGSVNLAMSDFADAVSNSTGALGDVLSFLGALKDFSEKEGKDDFSSQLADRLVKIGREVAEAFREASEDWAAEANPQIAALSDDVQAASSALQSVVSLLKAMSVDDGKPIKFSAAALAPVFQGLRYIVGQFRSLSEQVSSDGVQSVVAIVDALETIRSLFDDAPEQGGEVEDATRDWSDAVLRAFSIIEAIAAQMDGVLTDAVEYRDKAYQIAAALAAGNAALAGLGGISLDGGAFDASIGPVPDIESGPSPSINNIVQPSALPSNGGDTIIHNELDQQAFESLILDSNNNLTKKVYA